MKKIMIFAAVFAMSATAFAGVYTSITETSLKTGAFTTQEQAYNAGFDLVDQLKQMQPDELAKKLPIFEPSLKSQSVKLKDLEVHVEPFSKVRDQVEYRAVIDVSYQYQYSENDRN
ncbi:MULTISPECIES: DUF3316 domain-containing protein [Vibrio]|uniref:DUF3316 domain-containing protein n=7 Tax=Vibrio TaxID=662 RepID=A0A289GIQ6_VIBAN|nr:MULTISPECIES: DUF3316 domain-containing protein [Vibrio]AQM21083.1 hypothetical protein PN51_14825 [Vibrio anguillarum]AQP37676.1 hypothetical protein AA909_15055 [Vibrio anguillarum]ASW83281.1 DUF3316 domain-containing protein [Vibrio anguillarum]AUB86102.1 DUF3316 domain-containing protein [Vibrio anguillarum]AUB89539.1 DUF3316 domain-containing protein [Vibrio anguillarum]